MTPITFRRRGPRDEPDKMTLTVTASMGALADRNDGEPDWRFDEREHPDDEAAGRTDRFLRHLVRRMACAQKDLGHGRFPPTWLTLRCPSSQLLTVGMPVEQHSALLLALARLRSIIFGPPLLAHLLGAPLALCHPMRVSRLPLRLSLLVASYAPCG